MQVAEIMQLIFSKKCTRKNHSHFNCFLQEKTFTSAQTKKDSDEGNSKHANSEKNTPD